MALVVFVTDGLVGVALQQEGKVCIYDKQTDKCLLKISVPFRICCMTPGFTRPSIGTPTIFVGGHGGKISRYDAVTGELVQRYEGHRADVSWTFLLRDTLVSGSAIDRDFRQWDPDTGACLARYSGVAEHITAALVKRDSPLIVAGTFDGHVYLWREGEGAPWAVLVGHTKHIHCLETDADFLFSASNDKSIFQWDLRTHKLVNKLAVAVRKTSTHCMIRHGTSLYAANKDKSVREWDVSSGVNVRTWAGHTKTIFDLKVHGDFLFSSSMDKKACQWSLITGVSVRFFENRHWRTIKQLQVDGMFLYTASEDATVCKWDIATGQPLFTIDQHESFVSCLHIDGTDVFVTHDCHVFRFRLGGPGDGGGPIAAAMAAGAAAPSPGRAVASNAAADSDLSQYVARFDGHQDEITCVAGDGGATLWTGSRDATVRQWDLATNSCSGVLRGHTRAVLNMLLHNGELFTGSLDKSIIIWNLGTATMRARLVGHEKSVQRLLMHNGMLFSGSYDHTLRQWDPVNARAAVVYQGHTKSIKCLLCIGRWMLSGSFDHDVRVWGFSSGRSEMRLDGHRKSVVCLTASEVESEQQYFFSGSEDATIRMWRVSEGWGCVRVFEGHLRTVLCMRVQPGFRMLFSASEDGSVHQWSILTGQCCRVFEGHWNSVTTLVLSSDRVIITGSADKVVRRFKVEMPSLRELCIYKIRELRMQVARGAANPFEDVRALDLPEDTKDAILGVVPVTHCDVLAEIDAAMIEPRRDRDDRGADADPRRAYDRSNEAE